MEKYWKRKTERAERKKENKTPCFLRSEFSESTESDFYMILSYYSPVTHQLTYFNIYFFQKVKIFLSGWVTPQLQLEIDPQGRGGLSGENLERHI